jgi:hypothetical protein
LATEPANDERQEFRSELRPRRFWLWFGRVMWGANLLLLVGTLAWMLWDPSFPLLARLLTDNFFRWTSLMSNPPTLGRQLDCLMLLVVVSFLSSIGIFLTLFAGSQRHRSLRTWFAFTFLVAAWLTLFVAWPEIAWQGQRLRVWTRLDGIQRVATELQNNWPTRDGEMPEVGAFMAYPQDNPRTLMILAESQPPTNPRFSAIERSDDGTLRFELSGDETGSWLELHPSGSTPESFTGGLENSYSRAKSSPLGNGWYLVRYR